MHAETRARLLSRFRSQLNLISSEDEERDVTPIRHPSCRANLYYAPTTLTHETGDAIPPHTSRARFGTYGTIECTTSMWSPRLTTNGTGLSNQASDSMPFPSKLRSSCIIRKAKRSTSWRPSKEGVLRSALGDWTSTISLAAVVALRECVSRSAVIVSSVPGCLQLFRWSLCYLLVPRYVAHIQFVSVTGN